MALIALLALGVLVALIASGGCAASTSSAPTPTTTMLLRRDPMIDAVRGARTCLNAPSGSCDDALDRLQDELNRSGAPLAGLELRSTIPTAAIMSVRNAVSHLSFDLTPARACNADRHAPACLAAMPRVTGELDALERAAASWPGPVAAA